MKTATFDENLWKLVPVEPTDAMVKMGAEIIEDNGGNARWSDVREAWLHMLCMVESAAPEAPAQGQPLTLDEERELFRLREAIKGPDGFATWQEAAIAERVRRVKAERELAELKAQPSVPDPLEKLTRIQEELRLYDDKPAQGEQAAEPMRVTEFNVGRWCLSEDDCIEQGIDFAAYERGVADAADAFGRNRAALAQLDALEGGE